MAQEGASEPEVPLRRWEALKRCVRAADKQNWPVRADRRIADSGRKLLYGLRPPDVNSSNEDRPQRRRGRRWLVLILFFVLAFSAVSFFASSKTVLPGTVLVVSLEEGVAARTPNALEQLFGSHQIGFLDLAESLRRAANDDRVKGVLLRVGSAPLGGGRVDELRVLLESLRQSGKIVFAYATGPDTQNYLLASVANQIILDPSTTVNITGVRVAAFFLKDLLASFEIETDFLRVGKYKGAFEQFMRSAPTSEFDVAMTSLVTSLYRNTVREIADARGIDEDEVRALINTAPILSEEAATKRLVDHVLYRDEVDKHLTKELDLEPHFVNVADYTPPVRNGAADSGQIAVIQISGTIFDGESRDNMTLFGRGSGSHAVSRAIEEADDDDAIAAMLLFIDSPGGTVTGSETIWRAVRTAQKPVVACLSNTAASGGYYAACSADAIFAHAHTLTGSIGVFGGKIVLEKLFAEQGVGVRTYSEGQNASMFDSIGRFTKEERLRFEGLLKHSYDTFVDRVARGRGLSAEQAENAAQGRVWTGSQAVENGLVDGLGGIERSVVDLKKRLGFADTADLELRPYPPDESFWAFLSRRGASEWSGGSRSLQADGERWGVLRALEVLLRSSRLFDAARGLALMPFVVEAH